MAEHLRMRSFEPFEARLVRQAHHEGLASQDEGSGAHYVDFHPDPSLQFVSCALRVAVGREA